MEPLIARGRYYTREYCTPAYILDNSSMLKNDIITWWTITTSIIIATIIIMFKHYFVDNKTRYHVFYNDKPVNQRV